MKVLLTGANGFLGSHIVRQCLDQGYEVKAFILKGTPETTIQDLPYEAYYGDLLNYDNILEALETCDYVIHTAAVTDVWPNKNALSWKINYDVVKSLAAAVKEQNIKKYIHVGTANSFGFGSKENPGSEKSPFTSGIYELDYIDSKKAAQDFLLEQSQEIGLPVVVINPTFMIGENDSKPGPGELIFPVIQQKVPGYAIGGRCFAYVQDVAIGCVNALKKGQVGECYITGGQNLSYKEFFGMISVYTGVKNPRRKIPPFFALIFAGLAEIIAFFLKKKPLLTRTMAKMSRDGHYYTSSKAIRELDLPQTDIEIALQRAIDWYRSNGYVK